MKKLLFVLLAGVIFVTALNAQKPMTPEEEEDKMYEAVEKELERIGNYLELEDWQIFRIDSLLVHDYKGMSAELKLMSESKISNADMYIAVQDKWYEEIYNGFKAVLNEEQWAKYLKNGAAKAKKARDKRAVVK